MQAPAACLLLVLLARLLRAEEQPAQDEKPSQRTNNRILDHVVTNDQATQAAAQLSVAKLGISEEVGCGKCSLQERMYCVSEAVLNDHCCCDKHLEPMPYVPHRCYIKLPPAAPCLPISGNCAQYSRIFDCCCKHILQQRFPTRQNHQGWLASFISMIGLNSWSERDPAVDPVPIRPHMVGSQGSSAYQPFPSYLGASASASAQANSSYLLADEFGQLYPSNRTDTGHNKLVSGAHVTRGGLAALLATLAMPLLFR